MKHLHYCRSCRISLGSCSAPQDGESSACMHEVEWPELCEDCQVEDDQQPELVVVYIAGPYRGSSAWRIAENIRAAERLALQVWEAGAVALCPHLNTAHFQGEGPDERWLYGDLELLHRCDAMILVPGWEASQGAQQERQQALQWGMPIYESIEELRNALVGLPVGADADEEKRKIRHQLNDENILTTFMRE